jgi:hypothetical protein
MHFLFVLSNQSQFLGMFNLLMVQHFDCLQYINLDCIRQFTFRRQIRFRFEFIEHGIDSIFWQ